MKRWTLALKILVSVLFVVVLLSTIHWPDLARVGRRMDPLYVALSILLSFVLVAASCWKWWMLLRFQGHAIPFLKLYRWYFVGYFYSNFLPSNVGGDVARAWLAGREIRCMSTALISVLAERFTGMIFLFAMVVLMTLGGPLGQHVALRIPAVAAFGVLLAMTLLWFAGRLTGDRFAKGWVRIREWLHVTAGSCWAARLDRIESKIKGMNDRAVQIGAVLCTQWRAFVSLWLVTFLFYALTVLNVIVAYRAFGVWPDAAGIAQVLPAALTVAALPISLGSIGLAEGSYVVYFGLLGLGRELTLAMGLLLRMKTVLLGLIGLVVQMREPVNVTSAKELRDAKQEGA